MSRGRERRPVQVGIGWTRGESNRLRRKRRLTGCFRVYFRREPGGRLKKREGGTRTALQPSGVEVDLDALLNALEMRAGKHVGIVGVVHGHVQ